MSIGRWRCSVTFALVSLSAIPLSEARAQEWRPREVTILGCYALFEPDGRRVTASGDVDVVPVVQLDTQRHGKSATSSLYRVIERDSIGRQLSRHDRSELPPTWLISPQTDSLHVMFFNDYAAAGFAFAVPQPMRDTLFGRTRGFSGHTDPSDGRAVLAVRVPCRQLSGPGAG